MATRVPPSAEVLQTEYLIQGVVVYRATQAGVRGVRVDAWDKDTRYHDLLGQSVTDDQGAFTVGFDSAYFGDYAPDHSPDLFFRVYLDGKEVLNTFDKPIMNAPRGVTEVRLMLDMPQVPPTGTDRVSPELTLKAIDWWQASDFRGAWSEAKDKTSTVGKMLGALAGCAFEHFDFAPIRPQSPREKDIVGQDPNNAQRTLALQGVKVTEVLDVCGDDGADIGSLRGYPLSLHAQDQVVLYQQDGVVKFYTRVTPTPSQQVDGQTVARIDGDVQSLKARMQDIDTMRTDVGNLRSADGAKEQRIAEEAEGLKAQSGQVAQLQRDLADLRQANADKEAEIVKLQSDLTRVRAAQDNLAARLPLDRLALLEAQVRRLSPGSGSAVGGAVRTAPAKATRAAAKAATKTAGGPALGAKAPKAAKAAKVAKTAKIAKTTEEAGTTRRTKKPKGRTG
jgi:hypothetical protein